MIEGFYEFDDVNVGSRWRRRAVGYFPSEHRVRRFAQTYAAAAALLPPPDDVVSVDTSFGRVRAFRFSSDGDDPTPLVLMPGRGSSTPLWRANVELLARDRTVVSLDGLGEPGLSRQTRAFVTAADQAQYVDETLAGLSIDRAHLLGVSIGGWLAVRTALHRPHRIASVIALDPANTFAPLTWKMVAVSLGSVVPLMPQRLRFRLLSWISGGADASAEAEGELVASGMRDFVSCFPAPVRPTDAELAAIECPVLALIAGRSIVHDASIAAERARRLLPRGQVEIWPDATHAINGEFPERIARRVESFLAT